MRAACGHPFVVLALTSTIMIFRLDFLAFAPAAIKQAMLLRGSVRSLRVGSSSLRMGAQRSARGMCTAVAEAVEEAPASPFSPSVPHNAQYYIMCGLTYLFALKWQAADRSLAREIAAHKEAHPELHAEVRLPFPLAHTMRCQRRPHTQHNIASAFLVMACAATADCRHVRAMRRESTGGERKAAAERHLRLLRRRSCKVYWRRRRMTPWRRQYSSQQPARLCSFSRQTQRTRFNLPRNSSVPSPSSLIAPRLSSVRSRRPLRQLRPHPPPRPLPPSLP